jgi:hypothetical protein
MSYRHYVCVRGKILSYKFIIYDEDLKTLCIELTNQNGKECEEIWTRFSELSRKAPSHDGRANV